MLITASSDEVYSFTCLKDLVCQMVRQKSRNHDVIELVFLSPEFIVTDIGISFDEKLLKRIIYFSRHHPSLDHRQNRSRNFFQDARNKVLSAGASIENVSVDG